MITEAQKSFSQELVIAADDLGRSLTVNDAIMEAHDHGVLTSASMMPGAEAYEAAVQAARERGGMSIGLHVTLCDGRAVLPHSKIPDLTDNNGLFIKNPAAAWMKFGKNEILKQVEMEIEAQFAKLEAAGLPVSYVDSHHHLHMHPRVFDIVCRAASSRRVHWIRIPYEPASVAFGMRAHSRGAMPFVEWAVFRILRIFNLRTAEKYGMQCADHVYGLSRTGSVDEQYILSVIDRICGKVNEIFTHPDLQGSGRHELDALKSHAVAERIKSSGLRRTGYKDVSSSRKTLCLLETPVQ